jgi:ABC-2 type transport system ATP-binding protein
VTSGAQASGTEPALAAVGLPRRFGEQVAVDHLSFAVASGEVFGFLGPNGAGKSTTARMLTGFLPPSEGVARVEGIDVNRHPTRARRRIGVVPEEASVYVDLSVRRNVLLMGELHGVARAVRERSGVVTGCSRGSTWPSERGRRAGSCPRDCASA